MASTATERPARRQPRQRAGETVVEPYRVTPKLSMRVAILGLVVLGIFAALFLRLWALQVLAGTKYVDQAQSQSFRAVRLQAPRGMILASDGTPLVTNAAATAIQLWPADLPQSYPQRYAELRQLAHVARVPLYEISRSIKKLQGDRLTPVTVREAASGPMVGYLAEHSDRFPGVTMGRTYIRHYPYQQLAAQVLGYVGSITQRQLAALGKGYDLNDELGQSGVEASYDKYLRGAPGEARVKVDASRRPLTGVLTAQVPKPGNTVRLTINLKLQQAAEKALAYGIRLANSNGQWAARGGAIVALDPRDGSILAMASSPSYKPSVYAGHVTTKALRARG